MTWDFSMELLIWMIPKYMQGDKDARQQNVMIIGQTHIRSWGFVVI